ncbi:MAG: hypothetical protein PUB32_02990 [Clostridiales bacterium]|nr:hypothetical protein [Clostridiales bacterium]
MLFRKNVEPCCSYCAHSSPIDEETVICVKKGVVKSWGKCRRFEYDPLKREPETPSKPVTSGLSEDDFKI